MFYILFSYVWFLKCWLYVFMGANFVANLSTERLMLRQMQKNMLYQTLQSAHNQWDKNRP